MVNSSITVGDSLLYGLASGIKEFESSNNKMTKVEFEITIDNRKVKTTFEIIDINDEFEEE